MALLVTLGMTGITTVTIYWTLYKLHLRSEFVTALAPDGVPLFNLG